MAHRTVKSSYAELTERLNKFPQGAPPSEHLERILALIFSEDEARLAARLPIAPFKLAAAARAWKTTPAEAEKILDDMAAKALIVDASMNGKRLYFLPPPIAGFFEFSMMHGGRGEETHSALAELFKQYIHQEDEFMLDLFGVGETKFGRMLVREPSLDGDNHLHVLDHERATMVIEEATDIAVGTCYCRHQKEHLGEACDAPLEMCMALNSAAGVIVRHGLGRRLETSEALDLLAEAQERGLVQFAENVRRRVNFVCNCCSCCCEPLAAARRFAHLDPIHTTRFLPVVDESLCNACGRCAEKCPVDSMTIGDGRAERRRSGRRRFDGRRIAGERRAGERRRGARDPRRAGERHALVDGSTCLGCGLCVGVCARGALSLIERRARIVTPLDSAHRCVLQAIERGKLQNLVFSEQARASHRAMAAIFGVLLKLPPAKQVLASEQVRSTYFEAFLSRKQMWP